MPIPKNNDFFQLGDFTGFRIAGQCRVVTSFQPKDLADPPIKSVRGTHFAVLDDPWAIDLTDGRRVDLESQQVRPFPSEPGFDAQQAWQEAAAGRAPAMTERIDYEYQDTNSRTTVGADGAWLECTDVQIEPGQRLWFHWRFCRFHSSPFNDFALLAAYAGGDTSRPAKHRELLCDVLALERQVSSNRRTVWSSPWTVGVFSPAEGFQGTLRWVVSNGYSLPKLSGRRPDERFLRPSALLLDNFTIE